MSLSANFPTIRPSLLLDFANTQVLDPRITFTRSTTATYYDGVTTAKAEENLLLRSQEFNTTPTWVVNDASITTNAEVAPDGTSTAEKLVETATTNVHTVRQTVTTAAGVHTYSAYIKAAERTFAFLNYANIEGISIDLTTGTATSAVGSPTNIVSTDAGNGWWRVSFSFTALAGAGTYRIYTSADGVWANASYLGDGTSGIYIWGAQLEQRSAATAYTDTTTQPITNYIPVLQTAAANVARFDHNPTTSESLGLLIEEQRTNLALQSAFASSWSATRSSITQAADVAPDGTLSAIKVVEDTTASNSHYISQTIAVSNATVYTLSVYAKAAGRNYVTLYLNTSPVSNTYFDLANGTVATQPSGVTATITAVGNGWYRCAATWTTTSTSELAAIGPSNSPSTNSYTGNGYSGIYIWGAQLEVGAFPTSYIATTSASVTRNADAASMTGTNFSSWFNNAEGTMYVESKGTSSSSTANFQVDDGSTNNRITIVGCSLATIGALVVVSGVTQASGTANFTSGLDKNSLAYKVNDFKAYLNGASYLTDTSGTIPVVSVARIASNASVSSTATIKKLAYYPQRLTDAQLQALTS